jgi:hypothetical protein
VNYEKYELSLRATQKTIQKCLKKMLFKKLANVFLPIDGGSQEHTMFSEHCMPRASVVVNEQLCVNTNKASVTKQETSAMLIMWVKLLFATPTRPPPSRGRRLKVSEPPILEVIAYVHLPYRS